VDVSKGIEIKANQKDHGNKIMKSKDYDEAEDFYKKLITNMYYLNDYYPFRQLVKVYIKKKEYGNVINTIEEFFKSERYCSGSQLLWFKFKYKKACKYTGRRFSQFDECLEYFNEHGLKNKDKQNEPVPIAARLQTGRTKVKIIPQEDYDRKMEYEELRLTFKYADKYESKKKALYYYEQLWDRREFTKNLTAYRKLCSLYYDTQQYEKVLEVADEYFNSSARKTDSGISWFDKKVDQASKKLGKTPAQKTQQKPIKTTDIPPKNSVNANTMSNDELLIKYAELCEKGYLTRDEFDKKKKELLFNDSPVKQDTSSKIDENHLDTPVITISCSNFRKLIRYNIGDIINVKYRRDNIQLEIVETDNPGHVYDDLEDNLKLTVVKENFNIIRSLNEGELIIIKCKGRSEEVVLKFVGV